MRKVLFSTLLGIALAVTGCKKENKAADPATGSAAPATGSAAPAAADTTAPAAAPAGDTTAPAAVAPGEPAPAAAGEAPGPRPASLSDEDIALADKLVGAIEKMANGINEAGTDCPKVAAAIKSMSGEMSSIAEQGKKLNEKIEGDPAAKKWFEATYAPKVMDKMGKVMSNTCFSDKAVQDAMASIKMP
jgi:hypothetical protein